MKTYTMRSDAVRRYIVRLTAAAFALTAGVVVVYVAAAMIGVVPGRLLTGSFLIVGGVIGALACSTESEQSRLREYVLKLGATFLVIEQPDQPDILVGSDHIKQVRQLPFGLLVQTADRRLPVLIPAGLEDFDEIKQHLEQWT